MFNKILSTISMAAFSAMVLVGGSVAANAATVFLAPGNAPAALSGSGASTIYVMTDEDTGGAASGNPGSLVAGAFFSNTYNFDMQDVSGNKVFAGFDVTFAAPALGQVGISNLTFNLDGFSDVLTDSSGNAIAGTTNIGVEDWYVRGLAFGARTLTISGTLLANGGAYVARLSIVPLPPAALLFGTALFGIGALRRRKGKKAMDLAA